MVRQLFIINNKHIYHLCIKICFLANYRLMQGWAKFLCFERWTSVFLLYSYKWVVSNKLCVLHYPGGRSVDDIRPVQLNTVNTDKYFKYSCLYLCFYVFVFSFLKIIVYCIFIQFVTQMHLTFVQQRLLTYLLIFSHNSTMPSNDTYLIVPIPN